MISVSLLSAYPYCPRKIFLSNVLKFYEPPREATVNGTIRHEAFDSLNKSEEEAVKSIKPGDGPEQIYDIYKKVLSQKVRNSIIVNKDKIERAGLEASSLYASTMKHLTAELIIRTRNVYDFIEKRGIYGNELWFELTPKIKSEYKVYSEELGLVGIIDQIRILKESVIPIELKTGTAPKEGIWPNHRLQISAYVMLLEEQLNIHLEKGYIRYLDSDEEREVIMNSFMRQEVIDTKIKVEKLLKSLELPEKEKNENKCEKCGLRNECFDEKVIKVRLEALSQAEKRKI
jgi:CRISPR-associated protein Cas4